MSCYRRTPKGDQEIVFRSSGLGPDLRNLLLLINGRRDIPALAALAPFLRLSLEPLQFLEDNEYIVLDLVANAASGQDWQPALQAPAPVQASAPAAAPSAAPSPQVDLAFAARRERLMQHLAVLLGPDYEMVGTRLSSVRDAAELAALERKLLELVKLYRGNKEAALFSEKFKINP